MITHNTEWVTSIVESLLTSKEKLNVGSFVLFFFLCQVVALANVKIQCIVVWKLIYRLSWGKTGLLAFNVEEVHQLFSDGRRVIGSERDFLSTLFPSNLVKLKYYKGFYAM